MNILDKIYHEGAGILEGLHKAADPAYARKIQDAQSRTNQLSAIALAALVGSVALALLGLLITPILGVPLLIVSLPTAFFAYNGYKVSENMKRFLDNPKAYRNLDGSHNQEKLRERLASGTIAFGPVIDGLMEKIKSEKL